MDVHMTTEAIAQSVEFFVFILGALGLSLIMLVGGFLLGVRSRKKSVPFESGIDSVGTAKLRFSAKFYLVAMFFVIFDVEALYLYAWAVSIRETAWIGFIEAIIFTLTLLTGLIYLMRIGALNWAPRRLRLQHRINLVSHKSFIL